MGEKKEIRTIEGDPRVVAELTEWIKKLQPNTNFRELRDSLNKLSHCLLFGVIDKEMYTALMYGYQINTIVLRDALIEGGGTQLTGQAKAAKAFAQMTEEELRNYITEANTVKRIEMINDLNRRGHIIDAEEVTEVPKIKIKVTKPSEAAKAKPTTPKTGLLHTPLPATPPDEDDDECPI